MTSIQEREIARLEKKVATFNKISILLRIIFSISIPFAFFAQEIIILPFVCIVARIVVYRNTKAAQKELAIFLEDSF